jgi:hypothetical protein
MSQGKVFSRTSYVDKGENDWFVVHRAGISRVYSSNSP